MTEAALPTDNSPMFKERTLARLKASLESRQRASQTTYWGNRLAVRTTPLFLNLIRGCAQMRDISLGGYIRRAVAKQVAEDLGMTWEQVIQSTPYPSHWGKTSPQERYEIIEDSKGRPRRRSLPDNGEGFGEW